MAPKGMQTVAVRNISAHKVRMLLSVLAVVLGTAFVSGSFTFTTTLEKTFDDIVNGSTRGVDAIVMPSETQLAGVPAEWTEEIRGLDGVRTAEADISGSIIVIGKDGKPFQTGGAPSEGMSWTPTEDAVNKLDTLVDGRGPEQSGEIALGRDVADKLGFSVGDSVTVYNPNGGPIQTTLVGTYTSSLNVGGFVGVYFAPEQASELFTDGQHVASIAVAGDGTKTQDELVAEIATIADGATVETGQAYTDEQAAQMEQGFQFMNYFFVAFGVIALLVGTFIIFNTFSMLVAQRMRELALLRAIGAARSQIVGSVLVEATITGLVGSVLGVVLGFGLAAGIFWVLDQFDLGLPSNGLAFAPSAIVVPIVLGVAITVISAVVPAVRAGRTSPVVAMRSGLVGSAHSASVLVAAIIGVIGLVLGGLLAVLGSQQDSVTPATLLVGGGAIVMIISTFLVMPRLAPIVGIAIGRVIGAPFGAVGRLAATNAGRNSWRTAATAFALTLGVALVAAFGTLGASLKGTIEDAFEGSEADVVVQGVVGLNGPTPLPLDTIDKVRGVDGVSEVTGFASGTTVIADTPQMVWGVYGSVAAVSPVHAVAGEVEPHPDTAVVNESVARENGWQVGDSLNALTALGEPMSITLTGIYSDSPTLSGLVLGSDAYNSVMPLAMRSLIALEVQGADGVDTDELVSRISDAVSDNPIATVTTLDDQISQASGSVDVLLNVIYGMLALALIIAVLGIVNTLALSVIERTQELGMLRAIGTQRSQVRTAITLESTQIAFFGALIGAALGGFLGWAFVSAVASTGLSAIVVPWGLIGIVLVASALVGVIAAIVPAYRAARTSPLEAISEG